VQVARGGAARRRCGGGDGAGAGAGGSRVEGGGGGAGAGDGARESGRVRAPARECGGRR
jgi:hypothetical protein